MEKQLPRDLQLGVVHCEICGAWPGSVNFARHRRAYRGRCAGATGYVYTRGDDGAIERTPMLRRAKKKKKAAKDLEKAGPAINFNWQMGGKPTPAAPLHPAQLHWLPSAMPVHQPAADAPSQENRSQAEAATQAATPAAARDGNEFEPGSQDVLGAFFESWARSREKAERGESRSGSKPLAPSP